HDINWVAYVAARIEARCAHRLSVDFDDAHAGDLAAAPRQQGDVMTHLHERLTQPHDDALRAAVLFDRHARVLELDDVHSVDSTTRRQPPATINRRPVRLAASIAQW